MKASITKSELSNALGIVSKGISSRSTLAILSGVLISTQGKNLMFQSTDLEISVKCFAPSFIEEEGSVVVPGRLLSSIVHNLPDAAIQLSTEGNKFKVECMSSCFMLSTQDTADFPAFPELNPERSISLSPTKLAEMTHKVSKVVSRDESRAVLTGMLLSVEGGNLQLVATDSYRLAIASTSFEDEEVEPLDIIIPGRIFDEIMKSSAAEESITIGLTDNQIIFEFGDNIFVTRKIEGRYPNYKQLIPADNNCRIIVDTQALLAAVKRVSLLSQTHTPIKFTFDPDAQIIELVSQSQEVGTANESVDAEIVGDKTEIGFNHQYILDGLTSIDSEQTVIEVQTSLKPGIFKAMGEEKFLYLAMPVRLG